MSLIKITKVLLNDIMQHVRATGCTGITSIGCGQGQLEARLASVGSIEVVGVDQADESVQIPAYRRRHMQYICTPMNSNEIAPVPANHALLFCAPVDRIPFQSYLAEYAGRCLIIIVSGSCQPDPAEWSSHVPPDSEWQLTCSNEIVGALPSRIYMYTRAS